MILAEAVVQTNVCFNGQCQTARLPVPTCFHSWRLYEACVWHNADSVQKVCPAIVEDTVDIYYTIYLPSIPTLVLVPSQCVYTRCDKGLHGYIRAPGNVPDFTSLTVKQQYIFITSSANTSSKRWTMLFSERLMCFEYYGECTFLHQWNAPVFLTFLLVDHAWRWLQHDQAFIVINHWP